MGVHDGNDNLRGNSTSDTSDTSVATVTSAAVLPPRAAEALAHLMEGNARFAEGAAEHPRQTPERRESLADEQHPESVVLSCSDSRVAPEIIFDQGVGDIFDVRTAGEILDTAVMASLDFAVEGLGVSLLLVLGHEHCGAVGATRQTLEQNVTVGGAQSAILEQVGLSIRESQNDGNNTTEAFERHHAQRIAGEILRRSRVVSDAVERGNLGIVVGRYLVTTGSVELLPLL